MNIPYDKRSQTFLLMMGGWSIQDTRQVPKLKAGKFMKGLQYSGMVTSEEGTYGSSGSFSTDINQSTQTSNYRLFDTLNGGVREVSDGHDACQKIKHLLLTGWGFFHCVSKGRDPVQGHKQAHASVSRNMKTPSQRSNSKIFKPLGGCAKENW